MTLLQIREIKVIFEECNESFCRLAWQESELTLPTVPGLLQLRRSHDQSANFSVSFGAKAFLFFLDFLGVFLVLCQSFFLLLFFLLSYFPCFLYSSFFCAFLYFLHLLLSFC